MASNPSGFYTVAQELLSKAQTDGPYLRTVISRAYYGALIAARDARVISTRGISDSHSAVINVYKLGDAADGMLADHLTELRKLRRAADYEPKATLTNAQAQLALAHSKKVLFALKQLPPRPAAAFGVGAVV